MEAGRHQLSVVAPTVPVFLDADMTRLGQVFSTLLNNAAKYSEPGGQIQLLAQVQGSRVVVSVKDAGVGIAPDMLTRVFEMFTQVNHSLEKSQGGLGIGLCLVKQLVELHGGDVQAFSEGLGQGSEFVVQLPRSTAVATPGLAGNRPGESALKPKANSPRSVGAPAAAAKRRILVADDNADAVNSLSLFLTILDNDVRTATDGLQAVELAAQFQPDVILLDIGMPRLNGYDACRRIREQPGGDQAFLIALTG